MPPTRAQYENVETDHDLEEASGIFHRAVLRFQQLEDLSAPLNGSVLAIEDKHTARVTISSQVQMADARARDALEAFHDLTVEEVNPSATLRPFAQYALIRQACEAAALGSWLLRPSTKSKRVLRSLNLEFTHDQDAREFARSLSRGSRQAPSPGWEETLQRLNDLKNTVSQLREQDLKRIPPWSDILVDVSPPIGRTGRGHALNSPVVIWRIASAFLHGSSTTARMLSDSELITDFDANGIASMQMTPSWRVLATSYAACVQILQRLHDRYDHLATHDHSGNSVIPKVAP